MKILVADDDKLFRDLLCDIVKKEGYISIEAKDGQEAIDIFFSNNDIDIVLLDVMMPKYDGWQVLKEIRENSNIPIIMLTALGDEKNEVKGFDKGADDYIAKPFSFKVFVARLNKIAKKIDRDKKSDILIGKLHICGATRKVTACGEEINLNNKEYALLNYLIKNRDLTLTREQILNNVWGYDFDGDVRTIDTHIKMLRSKLNGCNSYIKTIRGIGYMFEVRND